MTPEHSAPGHTTPIRPTPAPERPNRPALELVHDSTRAPTLELVGSAAHRPTPRRVGAAGTTLGERLVEVGWRASERHHDLVRLAAEFAGTSEWFGDGSSSAARWISQRLDISVRTAREWIAVGRALRRLPMLDEALARRELSYAKVRILVRAATMENERELIDLACSVNAGALGAALATWSRREETEDVRDERHRESRSLSWRVEPDGQATGTLRLPPDVAGGVMAVIDAAVMRARQESVDRVGSNGGGSDIVGHSDVVGAIAMAGWPERQAAEQVIHPTLAQQRADALVAVMCGGGAQLSAEVILHVRGDGTTMDDGTPVTRQAVMRALPQSWVRALIHNAEGTPLNASARRRHPSARQKRVVKERDRRCVDCGGSDLLEYDHVPDFSISNQTVVDCLQLRCAACHRARHVRGAW